MTDWRAIAEILYARLEDSQVGLNDWLQVYASEMCKQEDVINSKRRICEAGTIGYISSITTKNRDAMRFYSTAIKATA